MKYSNLGSSVETREIALTDSLSSVIQNGSSFHEVAVQFLTTVYVAWGNALATLTTELSKSRTRLNRLVRGVTGSIGLLLLVACNGAYFEDDLSYRSHKIVQNTLVLTTKIGEVRLTALSDKAIEVEYLTTKSSFFPSFAIKNGIASKAFEVKDRPREIVFDRGLLKAVVNKLDLSIDFSFDGVFLSRQVAHFDDLILDKKDYKGFRFELNSDEKIMGGGERVLGMNRRGHRMPLHNRAHYGYSTESNQMNFSIPAIMSDKGYAILFDNTASGFLDIGKTEKNTLSFEAVSGRMSYIVFAGENYPEIIRNYVEVTGKQPLPARWLFGNFASRFGYKDQQEVLDTVAKFEQEDIPLDAIILDLYWFGPDIKGHMGNLDWDKKAFPKPKQMLRQLKDKNIKTILVTEPFVLSSSSKWQQAVDKNILAKDNEGAVKRFDFYFGNTGLIDVFDVKARDWFSDIYSDLTQQGVAGVWGDLGEPEVHPDDSRHYLSDFNMRLTGEELHNAYGHQWAQMVYENQTKIRPKERPFIMMRSGFAGSQRFAMIPWTGDVERSWNGLKPQVELSLQMGLFGMAYTHSDLGGFAGGKTFDKEMYIRWLQYGVFQPVYRPHAQAHIPPEPVFHDQQTKDILRKYIKLRYQLLPYNYNLAYENSATGMPLMRPVFFEDEADPNLIDVKDSYFWGDSFLVSPITQADEKQHQMGLPDGVWFDFWDDTRYTGGNNIQVPVSLERLPVMVRAGSFVPMIDPINNTQSYSSENLVLHYYADRTVAASQGKMFEDDGKDPKSMEANKFEILKFSAKRTNRQLIIDLLRVGDGYEGMPKTRKIKLVIHNWQSAPQALVVNRRTIGKKNFVFDSKTKRLTANLNWSDEKLRLEVTK